MSINRDQNVCACNWPFKARENDNCMSFDTGFETILGEEEDVKEFFISDIISKLACEKELICNGDILGEA